MKKTILTIALAAMCSFAASAQEAWINVGRYAEENAKITQTPKAVFYGDSITDGWAWVDADFFKDNNFVGRGISGSVTSQMLLRMRQDVIDLHPKYMVFLGGINDIAINEGPIDIKVTFGNIVSMIQLAKSNKIKPVICLLFPVQSIGWRPEVKDASEKVQALNAMLKDYCKANKVTCVEYFADIDKSAGRLPESLSKDSIHPVLEGYKIMEAEILKVLK